MEFVAKLDDYGLAAWIAVMALGFVLFWPAGLAVLAYLIWSGRMSCWKHGGRRRWYAQMMENEHTGGRRRHRRRRYTAPPSGNLAFDEYREDVLRRLEEEQDAFQKFLDSLRYAKDKAEFDRFMEERRSRPEGPEAPGASENSPGPESGL